jgi:hypothetical protein
MFSKFATNCVLSKDALGTVNVLSLHVYGGLSTLRFMHADFRKNGAESF